MTSRTRSARARGEHLSARPLCVLAGLALAGSLLAGCSGSASDDVRAEPSSQVSETRQVTPASAIRSAVDATAEAGSWRFVLAVNATVAGQTMDLRATGAYDPVARLGETRLELPGIGALEQRIIGDDLFITLPAEQGIWYRLSMQDLVGTSLASSADPSAGLAVFEGVSDDVQQVGEGQVRGQPATHYRGTVDVRKALESTGGAVRDALEQTVGSADLRSVPFDAWIDGEGRLVQGQQVVDLPPSEATGGQAVTTRTTMEMFDFGVRVDVQAPPAGQVRDGTPILDALSGGPN